MIISQNELDEITRKRYGSRDTIEQWSANADALVTEIENLRIVRHDRIANERTLESARRMLSAIATNR